MSQLRYFNAFILSSLTFLMFYFLFLSFADIKKIVKPTPSKVIKVSIINPPKKVAVVKAIEPIVKKIEKIEPIVPVVIPKPKPKKVIKKVKLKKIVKKKVIKKKIVKKKIIKKKVIKKKVVKKKIVKKRVIKQVAKEYVPLVAPVYHTPKPIVKPVVKPIVKTVPKVSNPAPTQVKNDQHKKAFLRNVRSKIIANKKYPKIAKRRHIEGSVKVRFDITKNGQVTNIRFINGKRIFQKSIKKTLQRTFPLAIPANVQGELPILDISVVLHFNIR